MKCEEITSRKNPNVVFASSLADKKCRDREGLFFFEGAKLLEECLKSNFEIQSIMFTCKAFEKYGELIESAQSKAQKFFLVSDSVYEKISDEKSPQGIFTVAYQKKIKEYNSVCKDKGIIFLDCVQNPSNLGTIVRSAYSLGKYEVVCTQNCADIYNPKTIRAAMGAVFKTNFYYSVNTADCFEKIKANGKRVIATVLSDTAVDIKSASLCSTDCLVIGNEGNGVSDLVSKMCDMHVIIPMQEGAESLNAAAACAIFIWEANRN